jgi:hypothetical protein
VLFCQPFKKTNKEPENKKPKKTTKKQQTKKTTQDCTPKGGE